MLDKLGDIGAAFDWITPFAAFIQDVLYFPAQTVTLPLDGSMGGAGWTGPQITRLLRSQGIRVWGEMIVDGQIAFTVRRREVQHVNAILEQQVWRSRPPRSSFLRDIIPQDKFLLIVFFTVIGVALVLLLSTRLVM